MIEWFRNGLLGLIFGWIGYCLGNDGALCFTEPLAGDSQIAALTTDAENGDGCSLKVYLYAKTFDESLRTMVLVERQNLVDRAAKGNIPTLSFSTGYNGSSFEAYLKTSKVPLPFIFRVTHPDPGKAQGHLACWSF